MEICPQCTKSINSGSEICLQPNAVVLNDPNDIIEKVTSMILKGLKRQRNTMEKLKKSLESTKKDKDNQEKKFENSKKLMQSENQR